MTNNRNYSYPNVVMLTAAKTAALNFKSNIAELALARSDWTPEVADLLIQRIDTAINDLLGTDAAKQLREATAALTSVQAPAKRDLSFFKTQIDEDFKNQPDLRNEILLTLGFAKNLKKVQKDNQQSLTQLLSAFKKNMTNDLKTTITARGMNPDLIDRIVAAANVFSEANSSQEVLKQSTKDITKEVADEYTAIYDEIIGICKKASNYYKFDTLKKEQFTFSKIVAKLGSAKNTQSSPPVA